MTEKHSQKSRHPDETQTAAAHLLLRLSCLRIKSRMRALAYESKTRPRGATENRRRDQQTQAHWITIDNGLSTTRSQPRLLHTRHGLTHMVLSHLLKLITSSISVGVLANGSHVSAGVIFWFARESASVICIHTSVICLGYRLWFTFCFFRGGWGRCLTRVRRGAHTHTELSLVTPCNTHLISLSSRYLECFVTRAHRYAKYELFLHFWFSSVVPHLLSLFWGWE